MTTEQIRDAIKKIGGVQRTAQLMGKHFSAVYRWEKGETAPDKANQEMLERLVELWK